MFRTIVFSAFGAGLLLCAALTALQLATTEPLLLQTEQFESAGAIGTDHQHGGVTAADHEHGGGSGHVHSGEKWAPEDGFERTFYTALANLVVGFAAALMLLGAMAFKGEAIDARRGILWGFAAFFALSLLPSIGLPPELPGTPAADILERQAWWFGAAAASVAGIGLIAFGRSWVAKAVGVGVMVLPHLVGAPIPPSHDVAFPGALAGKFVAASLAVSALLWIGAGLSAGWLHARLSRPA